MRHNCGIAIIGAGPAGIAAACAARECGKSVVVVDDNPAAGGQIWRGGAPSPEATAWMYRFAASGATLLAGHTVISAGDHSVRSEGPNDVADIHFQKLIIATGSREFFLPFPGWTLPGVFGVGGIQALVKSGFDIQGKRILIAGSGPLLMAVAAHLQHKAGADVVLLAEQTPFRKVLQFGASILGSPDKIRQAIALKWQLRGVRAVFNAWPVEVVGHGGRLSVVMQVGPNREIFDCDYLAAGFGLIPATEIAQLLGCDCDVDGQVLVNSSQQTSRPGIFAAGEATGIGGVEKSLIEGQIAGYASAGCSERAKRLETSRTKAFRFMKGLKTAYALRPELLRLARPDTIICRCEDVPQKSLDIHLSARDAKLQTRCGMGACQGRVCGGILHLTRNWTDTSVRPPLSAASVSSLSDVVPPA